MAIWSLEKIQAWHKYSLKFLVVLKFKIKCICLTFWDIHVIEGSLVVHREIKMTGQISWKWKVPFL